LALPIYGVSLRQPTSICERGLSPPHTVYNTALEQHLRDTLGARFAERPDTDPGKRPVREIVGVDPRLNQRWSTRRAHIEARRGELAIQFQHDHGRPPTPVEALHLAQQATLETRDAKHEPRSLTEQRATWLGEAAAMLGSSAAVASMVQTALTPPAETAAIVDSHRVAQTADHILAVMEESRATWQMWHVRAEAQRQVRTIDLPAEQAASLVDLLVDEVLDRRCVVLGAPAKTSRNRSDFYLDHGRVHVGDIAKTTEDAFAAWVLDRSAGLDAIMLAATRELVAELNRRARDQRLNGNVPRAVVRLADGNQASVGDVIITRSNDRRLRLTATDWVKNGDRWTITRIGRRGDLTVRHNRSHLTVQLPN
jgi:uncharacterized protein YecT (DUF1311 family)